MSLLRSEWTKLVTVRTTWLLLGAMLLIEGLVAGLIAGVVDIGELRSRDSANLLVGTPLSTVFVFTLGALLSTNEFRHGTANPTFIVSPRRERVVAAKLVVGIGLGVVAALLYIAVNAGLGLSLLSHRGIAVDGDTAVNIYTGVGVGLVLTCLFGVALGAVIRNQIVTVVIGLALFFLLRGFITLLIGRSVGIYLPAESLLALQGVPAGKDFFLSQVDGGLVFAGYCAALSIAGMVLMRVRDIT